MNAEDMQTSAEKVSTAACGICQLNVYGPLCDAGGAVTTAGAGQESREDRSGPSPSAQRLLVTGSPGY